MYLSETNYSGLPTKFEKFRQKIELTDNQRDKIKTSHKHLRENILQPLNYVSHTFLTGSYKKKTLVNPANDIDVFVVLKGYTQYDIKPNSIYQKMIIINSIYTKVIINYYYHRANLHQVLEL